MRKLARMKKDLNTLLEEMIEECDINNSDFFVTALLGLDLQEEIPEEKLQKILNEEGIYKLTDLLALTIYETWEEEDEENAKKLEKIKKAIIGLSKGERPFWY